MLTDTTSYAKCPAVDQPLPNSGHSNDVIHRSDSKDASASAQRNPANKSNQLNTLFRQSTPPWFNDSDSDSIDTPICSPVSPSYARVPDNFQTLREKSRALDINRMGWAASSLPHACDLYAAAAPIGNTQRETTSLQAKFIEFLSLAKIDVVLDMRHRKDIYQGEQYHSRHLNNTCNALNPSATTTKTYHPDEHGIRRFDLRINTPSKHLQKVNISSCHTIPSIRLYEYREWPDFSAISKQHLRALANVIVTAALQDKNVLVHCIGGIGRTGTVITYAQLRMKLLQNEHQTQYTQTELQDIVQQQLTDNRLLRPSGFVDSEPQEALILETLSDDLVAHGRLISPTSNSQSSG